MNKAEEFKWKMIAIADQLEALRLEIYQNSLDEEKSETNDKIFELQSEIRTVAQFLEWCYFKGD